MRIVRGLLLLFLALMTGASTAAIITFEDIPNNTEFTDVVTQGFRIQANNRGAIYIAEGNPDFACDPPCAANGTRTLLAAGPLLIPPPGAPGFADTITVTLEGGGDFLISGFDVAELFSGDDFGDNATRIDFVGLLDGVETFTGSFFLDMIIDGPGGLPDFQTVVFSSVLVDTFIFTGAGSFSGNNGFSLDNIVVSAVDEPGPTPVPEPGTLALALAGAIALSRSRAGRRVG